MASSGGVEDGPDPAGDDGRDKQDDQEAVAGAELDDACEHEVVPHPRRAAGVSRLIKLISRLTPAARQTLPAYFWDFSYRPCPCPASRPCRRRSPAGGSPNRSGSWPTWTPGRPLSGRPEPGSDRRSRTGRSSRQPARSGLPARPCKTMSRSPVRMTAESGTSRPSPIVWSNDDVGEHAGLEQPVGVRQLDAHLHGPRGFLHRRLNERDLAWERRAVGVGGERHRRPAGRARCAAAHIRRLWPAPRRWKGPPRRTGPSRA